jgi:hypothetical protein
MEYIHSLQLQVEPLQERIERTQLRWFGHVCRMDDQRYPKQAFEARPEGRKKTGRPRVKWEENVRRGLQERGVDWRQARKTAMDRSAWRSLV